MIVIGHCSMNFEEEMLPLLVIHKFNMVSVCFFFFVSGLSLSYNLEHKENYLVGFIKNKVILLIIFAFITEIVGRILKNIFLEQKFVFDHSLITGWNWYIYEMSVLYLIFYMTNKYIEQYKLREILLWLAAVCICLFTLFCYKNGNWNGWSAAYYYSTFSFPFGVTLYWHFDYIQSKVMRHPIVLSLVLIVIAACTCISLAMPSDSIIGGILLRNMMGCCIMMCLFIILNKLDIIKISVVNKLVTYLTRFSTEIYLYQFCWLEIWAVIYRQKGWTIDLTYVMAVVGSTLILGYIMHFVDLKISRVVRT